MPTELQHDNSKFALAGLDLNVPVDLVPPTKYAQATNVLSRIEGQLQSRDGITSIQAIVPGVPIHTIFRLTQPNPQVNGERLVGLGSLLFTAPLPNGNAFSQLTGGPSFDGGPISIITFQFDSDPAVWAIIANSAGMMKRRAGYYQQLGIAPPATQATATAGGIGLLNSTTGTPYDWRYTYVNSVTNSEGNPSPIMTASSEIKRPTANLDPDPAIGGSAFINPQNAYDGVNSTAATNNGVGQFLASLRITSIPATTFQYSALTLNVIVGVSTFPLNSLVSVLYSTDGGVSFNTLTNIHGVIAPKQFFVALPSGQDLTKVQVAIYSSRENGIVTPCPAAGLYEVWTSGTINPPINVTLALNNQSANVCVAIPIDPQVTDIRLYRRGGTLPNNWFMVGQYAINSLPQGGCGLGSLQINDNVADSVAEVGQLLNIDNFQPIQSIQATNFPLPIVFGPAANRVLATGDPARPSAVYFSVDGNADQWPAENWVSVANPGEQVMNGINYSLRTFAFSRERMYIMLPNIIAGVTFTPAETSCRRGLKGRWALTAGEQGIYFVAKDGVYRTQGGPEQSIIDDSIRPLFPTYDNPQGVAVNGYDAVDMSFENQLRLTYHNGEVYFYYQGFTTGQPQLMIFDERRSRWRPGTYTPNMLMGYSEPNTTSSLLLGGTDGTLYASGGVDDNGQPIFVQIQTGAMDQGRPLNLKEYLTVNFDVNPGGANNNLPIVVTPLINGNTLAEAAILITGNGRQRVTLPLNQSGAEVYAYNIAFRMAWQGGNTVRPIFYQYEIMYRHEPTETTHWELPQTGLAMEGWFHIRDIYVVLRSQADVILKVTPQGGATQTFTLPNTSGAKNTVYVQLAASKGNSYAFTLDSALPFRMYSDECDVRCKQWLTNLGYKNIPLIGREQVGRPLGSVNV